MWIVTWFQNVCVSLSKVSSILCTSQNFTGVSLNQWKVDAITPMIVSFSLTDFHHTETWKYSFLMPFMSTFHGEILEYITTGHFTFSCGITCGNILSPTFHVNVAFAVNLLYTNSFTLIILSLLQNKIYFQCLYEFKACANLFSKFFKTSCLLSMIPCLKNDLGSMRGVPNSRNFAYSASPCFVPITYSNFDISWYQIDLFKFPVTFLDGSFGGLFGSLGVIFMISFVKSCTLSTKAIPIALSTFAWSNFIFAIYYLITSHKTNKWSSFPSNHGVDVTNFTSYHWSLLSWILSPSEIDGPKSILTLWVVFIYSTSPPAKALYFSDLKSKRHLMPVSLAVGHVVSSSQMLFFSETFGKMAIVLLKSFAKLLKRLFAIIIQVKD